MDGKNNGNPQKNGMIWGEFSPYFWFNTTQCSCNSCSSFSFSSCPKSTALPIRGFCSKIIINFSCISLQQHFRIHLSEKRSNLSKLQDVHPRSLTASLPLKNGGWNTFAFPFGFRPIFRGYVKLREGNSFCGEYYVIPSHLNVSLNDSDEGCFVKGRFFFSRPKNYILILCGKSC